MLQIFSKLQVSESNFWINNSEYSSREFGFRIQEFTFKTNQICNIFDYYPFTRGLIIKVQREEVFNWVFWVDTRKFWKFKNPEVNSLFGSKNDSNICAEDFFFFFYRIVLCLFDLCFTGILFHFLYKYFKYFV